MNMRCPLQDLRLTHKAWRRFVGKPQILKRGDSRDTVVRVRYMQGIVHIQNGAGHDSHQDRARYLRRDRGAGKSAVGCADTALSGAFPDFK